MSMTTIEEEAIDHILDACKLLGWNIKIRAGIDEEPLNGFVIGTTHYLENVKFIEEFKEGD